jgi:YfiH family protein
VTDGWIRHPLLAACGVEHGFGLRGSAREGLLRPHQVHGARVVTAAACAGANPPDADAIISKLAAQAVAVVTADCVPILVAAADGSAVAAIHAGWRGLAAGVIGAGVAALGELAGGEDSLVAVVGPHIGACCYEVDEPVLTGLSGRFGDSLADSTRPTRPDHVALDLGELSRLALRRAGIPPAAVGSIPDVCTRCDATRFHSYRRDGARSGRLVHFIAARKHKA